MEKRAVKILSKSKCPLLSLVLSVAARVSQTIPSASTGASPRYLPIFGGGSYAIIALLLLPIIVIIIIVSVLLIRG